jgi:Flp pilus assembly pilin Flp
MEFIKRLLSEERGQALAEYALIVFLVMFAFWLGIKTTNIGDELVNVWTNIVACLGAPFSCSS